MTYEQIVAKAKEVMASKSAEGVKDHLAAEIHIAGEGEGAFYVEVKDGNIDVQPYEYYDRDFILTATADDLLAVVEGKLAAVLAYTTGKIKIDGSVDKALEFQKICKSAKTAPKAAEKPASKPVNKPAAGRKGKRK